MTTIEQIKENAKKAFEKFKMQTLEKTKNLIFGDAFRIAAITEIKDYIQSWIENDFGEEELKILAEDGEGLLMELYDCYQESGYTFDDYEDIRCIVREYLDKKSEEEQ